MPQKFLSLKNFEKYQHYKQRNPPWVKVHKTMLGDPEFMKLSATMKYVYIGLIILASETDNRVLNDRSFIAHRLCIQASDIDLNALYRSGFLLASRKHVASMLSENAPSDSDSSDNSDSDNSDTEKPPAASPSVLSRLDDFSITPDLEAWAAKESISNPSAYLEEFKDYWHSVGGKRRNGQTIQNWSATFKNRLRDLKKANKLKTPDWQEEFLREQA